MTPVGRTEIRTLRTARATGRDMIKDCDRRRIRELVDCREVEWEEAVT